MSWRTGYLPAVALAAAVIAATVGWGRIRPAGAPPQSGSAHRLPRIYPDYQGVTVPPNIAPLNFRIDEPGARYVARLSGEKGRAIEVSARDGSIRIPARPWRELLAANRGGEIRCDVFVEGAGGQWSRFDTLRNRVAAEEIDGHLVYRRLGPVYNMWARLSIHQRDLSGFREGLIFDNRRTRIGCVNCHTFLNGRPDRFILHTRPASSGGSPAMLLADGKKATRVDTRTAINRKSATYSSWHPSGKLLAFSHNNIVQYFHTAGREPREVVDLDSGLALYWVDGSKVTTTPAINQPHRLETFPGWSADGRYLYFSSAPMLWPNPKPIPVRYVPQVRYDLMRASFDIDTGRWGPAETVVTARQAGQSILEPRVSPDGRFALVTLCDYGSFPIFQEHSDLYLVDLRGKGFPLVRLFPGLESQRDSWHSWSRNSRWIVFSRKKETQVLARPHLCYIDATGRPSKPFVLPQEDPGYYDECTDTFNAPELVTGPVRISGRELTRAANSDQPVKATAGNSR